MSRNDEYFAATAIRGKLLVWGIVLSRPWDAKHLIFHPEWAINFWLLDRPLDRKVKTLADLGDILSRSFDWHLGRVLWIHQRLERDVRTRWGARPQSDPGTSFVLPAPNDREEGGWLRASQHDA